MSSFRRRLRVYGRVTVYGEYLLAGQGGAGLVLRCDRYLECGPSPSRDADWYDSSKDGVRELLIATGYRITGEVSGNLPLGRGLAGSSALCFLHLTSLGLPVAQRLPIVDATDAALHGFTPSGLDSTFCARQADGIFGARRWRDAHLYGLRCDGLLIEKERKLLLPAVRGRVHAIASVLCSLAERMTHSVEATGELPYGLFLEYCMALADAGVYSRVCEEVVRELLDHGIAAKGTGGLYDKAVLIFYTPRQADSVERIVGTLTPVTLRLTSLADRLPRTRGRDA